MRDVTTGQFLRGTSGNPHGRPKGTPNRSTVQVRDVAQALILRGRYLRELRRRLDAGELPPAVEVLLWHYAHGRPRFELSLAQPEGPRGLMVTDNEGVPLTYVALGVGIFERTEDAGVIHYTFTPTRPAAPVLMPLSDVETDAAQNDPAA